MTARKMIGLTRQTFVGKIMSLLFNIQVIHRFFFLTKEQAYFNFMAAVTVCSDFGAKENKVCHCFYRRKGKIYPSECRVAKSSKDKKAFLSDQCKEIEENNRMGKTRDLFKKIKDTKGTFDAKMGTIKDRNRRN